MTARRDLAVVRASRHRHPPATDAGLHRETRLLPSIDVVPAVHAIVRNQVRHPAAPLTIAAIVVLFLLVQHRIDGRDPKLSSRIRPEPTLEFGSAVCA